MKICEPGFWKILLMFPSISALELSLMLTKQYVVKLKSYVLGN